MPRLTIWEARGMSTAARVARVSQVRRSVQKLELAEQSQPLWSLKLFWPLVSHAERSFMLSVDGAKCQPFERRAKQQQVVFLPQCVVRRTGKIDEYVLV